MNFNINDYVTVSLTPEGQSVLTEYYQELGLTPPEKYEGQGPHTFQIWDLMHIFGGRTEMAKPQLFQGNALEITKGGK